MKDLVSILIPCYNGELFLDRCFNCLLSQTYSKIEIIFVNDGSSDNSETMADKYQFKLNQKGFIFKYIYQENGGAASAINTALKYVEGEYIMLYDVDDIIFSKAVESKVEFLKNNLDYDMVRNNGYYVNDSDLDNIIALFTDNSIEKNNEHIFEDLILGKTNNWTASFMVRTKSLFEHIQNKDIYISQFGQNLQIMLPVAYFGKSGYIDEPLMKYIKHNNSHSAFTNHDKKLKLMNGYEENRVEIIKQLDIPYIEKQRYFEMISTLYNRIRMSIAYEFHNIELLEKEYQALVDKNEITKQDKVLYKRAKNRYFDNLYLNYYRVINKLKRMVHK